MHIRASSTFAALGFAVAKQLQKLGLLVLGLEGARGPVIPLLSRLKNNKRMLYNLHRLSWLAAAVALQRLTPKGLCDNCMTKPGSQNLAQLRSAFGLDFL